MTIASPPPSAGPKKKRGLKALSVGTYTDIFQFSYPSEATPGQTVDIWVKVANLADYGFYIAVIAEYSDPDTGEVLGEIPMSPDYAGVDPGTNQLFSGSFTMPDKPARVAIWSFYWTGADWYEDDYVWADIQVAGGVAYQGSIIQWKLGYTTPAGERKNVYFPISDVPQNSYSGIVRIWGQNDMDTTQRLGIWWQVKDPDGIVVSEYAKWQPTPYTLPGTAKMFSSDTPTFSKVGTYTIAVQLFMNYANQVVVDDYDGDLCTVVGAVGPSEFRNFGVGEYNKV